MNQSKKVKDGALFIGVFLGLLLISLFIPFALLICMFLLPIPFVVYTYRYDWQPALVMLAVAVLLSLMIAPMVTLPMTVLVGLGGIMIGAAINHRLTSYETWARGSIGFIAGLLFVFLFSQFVLQINWTEEIDQLVEESLEISNQLVNQFGLGEQTDEQLEALEDQLTILKDLIPVTISIIAIILAFITQWVSYKVINRLENKQFKFPPFRSLRLPAPIIWIYFFAIVLMLINSDAGSMLYIGSYNIFILVGFFVALQGFSFIFFFAYEKKVSHILPVTSIILAVLFPFIVLYLVRILGIIDIGFGLRDRLSKDHK